MLRLTRVLVALTGLSALSLAGQQVVIKKVPVKKTLINGQEMYASYCAACHGTDATGNGPAAAALKTQPTDLTTLSAQNGGKFPGVKIFDSIRWGKVAAHGTPDMPVWGPLLETVCMSQNCNAETDMRIRNLTEYIKTLQR